MKERVKPWLKRKLLTGRWRTGLVVSMLMVSLLLLSACVPGDGTNDVERQAGFFWGVWHGWIAPVSLIMGWFNPGVRVYEVNNTGWWYDFGFYIAIIGGFGGIALSRRQRKKEK